MPFAMALLGMYLVTSNPESVSSWVAISPVTSTRVCSRSWISWRFAPVSEGRSPAIIQYLRDVGFCRSPKRAGGHLFRVAPWPSHSQRSRVTL